MINELIFLCHVSMIGIAPLIALRMGKEALIALICVQGILANLFVLKQITLCGLAATASDAYSIGAVLSLNVLQEYFGRDTARKALWISVLLLLFYTFASMIQLWYAPCSTDAFHLHYRALLQATPRIISASLLVYTLVQYIDSWLFAQLKSWLNSRFLVARMIMCVGVCQLLDTLLFTYLGLYGIMENLGEIIMVSYAVKLTALLLASPFVELSRRIAKQ